MQCKQLLLLLHNRPISLHGSRSKSHKRGQINTLHNSTLNKKTILSEIKMPDSEGIKEIVNQVAIQAGMAVMTMFIDTDSGSWLATMPDQ